MSMTQARWLRRYALLALRLDRITRAMTVLPVLDYRGPERWRAQVDAEEPAPAARLAEEADALLAELPFEAARAVPLTGQVRAMRAVAERLSGVRTPMAEYASRCLGLPIEPVPEAVFAEAHDRLDAALPPGPGGLADRWRAWKQHHRLAEPERLPGFVTRAITETRARTAALVPLPADEVVECELVSGVPYLAAGLHRGGVRSALLVNRDLPFVLADLLAVVAHEGHPGHIAEQVCKEHTLVRERGWAEAGIKFLISPQFALGEGLGQCGADLVFPGDEAQRWLTDHVLGEAGIPADGSDFAAVHSVTNVLWGVWANAALRADEGASDDSLLDYLARWTLLDRTELAPALPLLRGPNPYVFGYYHGWRRVRAWLDQPDRAARLRRLLTEPLHPDQLRVTPAPPR
ncbi:hypothetical protein [Nocardia farcinica]|uniref:DUF885 domain-containing protein n=1 Tax=Nocardia farcinica (strain IFM 10152) TaxID=247156 RepID=Q5YXD8_NOCFA|nr:hypothetical protein [Nocardia farcinica]BAD57153.1 hypothetical protein NFA_23060 [Nocardia farcinica IFM 10152]